MNICFRAGIMCVSLSAQTYCLSQWRLCPRDVTWACLQLTSVHDTRLLSSHGQVASISIIQDGRVQCQWKLVRACYNPITAIYQSFTSVHLVSSCITRFSPQRHHQQDFRTARLRSDRWMAAVDWEKRHRQKAMNTRNLAKSFSSGKMSQDALSEIIFHSDCIMSLNPDRVDVSLRSSTDLLFGYTWLALSSLLYSRLTGLKDGGNTQKVHIRHLTV